ASCFTMVNGLQNTVLGVRGHVNTALRIDAAAGLIRLMFTLVMVIFYWISAEAALIGTLASSTVALFIGRICVPEVPLWWPRKYDRTEQQKLFRYVLPLIPGFLYYALQPSILIWLSAIFGNAERVAEVGAISRIGQIISFLGFGLNLIVLPHLVSLRD